MNVVELIENAKTNFKDRIAYQLKDESITFDGVYQNALKFADYVSKHLAERSPVVVISEKHLLIPSVYLGVAMGNCYYVPVSCEMPKNKINAILQLTEAQLIICDEHNVELVKTLEYHGAVLTINEGQAIAEIDAKQIQSRSSHLVDVDPLYVIFTSGSTGIPKGVVTSHQAVIDYLTTFAETFQITKQEILGNQAPLDYIAGIRDIYIPMITGCRSVFIPKNFFSIPTMLFQCLNDFKITTICWVSSALSLCCQFNLFKQMKLKYVKKVFFTGSVFDVKHLNIWKSELKNAMFVNHYGPTEITASCTYYVIDNKVEYVKSAPIGIPFKNRKVFILNENQQVAKINEVGEICVGGKCLALGYYKNPELTNRSFVQNPTNKIYSDRIYLTGDLGYLDESGNLVFVGRKDNQIKHMGHRVELGEIEEFAVKYEKINEACCLYHTEKSVITLFYSGAATPAEISQYLRENLPSFMIPRKLINLETLPKLFNGKLDRQAMKKLMESK